VLAALTHNLLRWSELIGLPGTVVRAARTVRRRLLALPGRRLRRYRAPSRTSRRSRRPGALSAARQHQQDSYAKPPERFTDPTQPTTASRQAPSPPRRPDHTHRGIPAVD
jgi:hypothetical protein